MDDINFEDPRKSSAKQLKQSSEDKRKKGRSFFNYLFDLVVKTLLLFTLIAIDFALFANAGSYNMFAGGFALTTEAGYIFLGILLISFILMLAASFIHPLENIVIAMAAAILTLALINQFAAFDKKSVLTVLLHPILDDTISNSVYNHSFAIIALVVFVVVWLLLCLLKRQIYLYLTLAVISVLAWVVGEAYFKTSSQYFRTIAASPALRSEKYGENLIFLSFNNLTSPLNLERLSQKASQYIPIRNSYNNALGFYTQNDFTLYVHALVQEPNKPFNNLIGSYNPDMSDLPTEHTSTSVIATNYFDFTALQQDKLYLRDSSLYNTLKSSGYTINAFQTRDIDICHLNDQVAVAQCKEKINMPVSLNGEHFSTIEKTILLSAQWIQSTGFVSSVNPALKLLSYVLPYSEIAPIPFNVSKLYALNSFKVFDQIVESLDKHSGNQAYFAVIDLPSETYLYNEFCQLKPMKEWQAENPAVVANNIDIRRNAYAEQVSCVYGLLEKFMRQLDKIGSLDNTTIIIEGLNTPLGLNKVERDYYLDLQDKSQVALAIRPSAGFKAQIDYSICNVNDILNAHFFTHQVCHNFAPLKTTNNNIKNIIHKVKSETITDEQLKQATEQFGEWFKAWAANNNFEYTSPKRQTNAQTIQHKAVSDSLNANTEQPIEEQSAPQGEDVIPETLFDATANGLKQEAETQKIIEAAKQALAQEKEQQQELDEKAVQDLKPLTAPQASQQEEPSKKAVAKVATPKEQEAAAKPIAETITKAKDEEMTATAKTASVLPKKTTNETAQRAIAQPQTAAKTTKQAATASTQGQTKSVQNSKTEPEQTTKTLRDILDAPVAEGQNLSPEELKKQYRQNLQKTAQETGESLEIISVKVIDNLSQAQ